MIKTTLKIIGMNGILMTSTLMSQSPLHAGENEVASYFVAYETTQDKKFSDEPLREGQKQHEKMERKFGLRGCQVKYVGDLSKLRTSKKEIMGTLDGAMTAEYVSRHVLRRVGGCQSGFDEVIPHETRNILHLNTAHYLYRSDAKPQWSKLPLFKVNDVESIFKLWETGLSQKGHIKRSKQQFLGLPCTMESLFLNEHASHPILKSCVWEREKNDPAYPTKLMLWQDTYTKEGELTRRTEAVVVQFKKAVLKSRYQPDLSAKELKALDHADNDDDFEECIPKPGKRCFEVEPDDE